MATSNWTLAQLTDALGDITLLTAIDATTKKPMSFTVDMLPPTCLPTILLWLNQRLGGAVPPTAV